MIIQCDLSSIAIPEAALNTPALTPARKQKQKEMKIDNSIWKFSTIYLLRFYKIQLRVNMSRVTADAIAIAIACAKTTATSAAGGSCARKIGSQHPKKCSFHLIIRNSWKPAKKDLITNLNGPSLCKSASTFLWSRDTLGFNLVLQLLEFYIRFLFLCKLLSGWDNESFQVPALLWKLESQRVAPRLSWCCTFLFWFRTIAREFH